MRVHDPLYGAFDIEAPLLPLVMTPEVRRLSQVRLINTLTPSLAVLGELRRYSHTLGVLHLQSLVATDRFTPAEVHALGAAALLHDIGTPPFGHLFEYHLREQSGWTHESVIREILWGFHAPENRAHQMFAGRTIAFARTLDQVGIPRHVVEEIVSKAHPLACLLFGTLDLDNIDNVARMGWALGLPAPLGLARDLSRALRVHRDGSLRLSSGDRPLLHAWMSLRREVYSILAIDPPTVAAQAVLYRLIESALASGDLAVTDWYLSDEDLLTRLQGLDAYKLDIAREFLGLLPSFVFAVQMLGDLRDCGFANRGELVDWAERTVKETLPEDTPIAYVFVDHGTFEKRCTFVDEQGQEWSEGNTSKSVILHVFNRGKSPLPAGKCRRAAATLREALASRASQLLHLWIGPEYRSMDDQPSLPFAAQED